LDKLHFSRLSVKTVQGTVKDILQTGAIIRTHDAILHIYKFTDLERVKIPDIQLFTIHDQKLLDTGLKSTYPIHKCAILQ
jgi:hypothetical protein